MKSLLQLIFLAVAMIALTSSRTDVDPSEPRGEKLIVWNVGQGLWITWVTQNACHHFDAGGETAPWKKISQICLHRKNILHFSHWDSDHIRFVAQIARKFSQTCVYAMPAGEGSARKIALFARVPACLFKRGNEFSTEEKSAHELIENPPHSKAAGSNDVSRVYILKSRVLLPGDSPMTAERYWSGEFSLNEQRLPLLILGHHGSKTATSKELLDRLPNLKQAVASARRARYGHPHLDVVARLTHKGVATLSTEDWGTLIFQWPEGH